jgi:hypothetical protein
MRLISERYSRTDGNIFLSCIVEYGDRKFKITTSPTKLHIWSGLNGWLYIDNGDSKDTSKEHIEQFLPIMRAFSNEKENF